MGAGRARRLEITCLSDEAPPQVTSPVGSASRWVGEGLGVFWHLTSASSPLAVPSALRHGAGAASGEPGH